MLEFARPLRSRYAEADRCTCVVDGEPRPPEAVTLRMMNFGQHWRTEGIVDVEYRVEVPRELLLELVREQLPEIESDSRAHPEDDGDLERALREAGWPAAEEAMAQPRIAELLAEWFVHDLLLHWFGDGKPEEPPGFVLNTIDRVTVAERIGIEGRARRGGIPVRYQDA